MPKLISNDTISLLEVGIDFYILALNKLYCPQERHLRIKNSKYASVMGLLGSSVELLSKACLVEANGINSMYENNSQKDGKYKFAQEALNELKNGIKNNDDIYKNILKSLNPDELKDFEFLLSKFKLLQVHRANGLHAGIGVSRDIANIVSSEVYKYIYLLGKTKKFKAYIKNIPIPLENIVDREAILEDISRRINNNKGNKLQNLKSMYIVLPYVPEIEPEWLKLLEESSPIAKRYDLSYLVKTLTDAHGIYLVKNRGGHTGLSVKVDNDNPDAIPISIQNIKRELKTYREKFNNEILTSNTRLKEHKLDLPNYESVVELFCVNLLDEDIITKDRKLTALDVWPFITTSLSYSGTIAPIWFLTDKCDELDKLISLLSKTILPISKGAYSRRINTMLEFIAAKKTGKPFISSYYELSKEFREMIDSNSYVRKLDFQLTVNEQKSLIFAPTYDTLQKRGLSDKKITDLINELITTPTEENKTIIKYFIPKFKYEDRALLLQIFENKEFDNQKTTIKKLFRDLDFQQYGPIINHLL